MHFAPFRHGVLEQSSMSIWHTGPVKPEEGTGAAGVRGVACVSLHYEKDAERCWVRVPVGLVPMGRQKKDYSPLSPTTGAGMAGRSPGHQRPPGVSPPLLLPLPGFASG